MPRLFQGEIKNYYACALFSESKLLHGSEKLKPALKHPRVVQTQLCLNYEHEVRWGIMSN